MRELTLEELGFVSGGKGKADKPLKANKVDKQIAKLEKRIAKETANLAADTEALAALLELPTGG